MTAISIEDRCPLSRTTPLPRASAASRCSRPSIPASGEALRAGRTRPPRARPPRCRTRGTVGARCARAPRHRARAGRCADSRRRCAGVCRAARRAPRRRVRRARSAGDTAGCAAAAIDSRAASTGHLRGASAARPNIARTASRPTRAARAAASGCGCQRWWAGGGSSGSPAGAAREPSDAFGNAADISFSLGDLAESCRRSRQCGNASSKVAARREQSRTSRQVGAPRSGTRRSGSIALAPAQFRRPRSRGRTRTRCTPPARWRDRCRRASAARSGHRSDGPARALWAVAS